MRTHACAVLVICALLSWAAAASAGINANGALVLHTNDAVEYTHSADYCGGSFDDPGDCASAITRTEKVSGDPAVIWALAAFPENASPGVSVIYFGIEHSLAFELFADWSMCGTAGSLEIPDDDWPYTGLGNSVAFGVPVVGDVLFPFYWFAAYGDAGSFFATAMNPTGGYAGFVDTGNPPQLDYIESFGTVRWHADGANECPGPVVMGACCFYSGACLVLEPADCANQGGTFQGDGVPCDPNPCPQPPTGACCFADGSCFIVVDQTCVENGGVFQGDGVPCDPNPCPLPIGACCFEDGHCEIMDSSDCAVYAGQFMGVDVACDPNPCTQPSEACCFANGNCAFVPRESCEASGGNPQGPGTNCDMISCRPPQLGACCLDTGACVVNLQEECDALGGYYLAGTPCEPTPCDDVAVEPTTWGRVRAAFR